MTFADRTHLPAIGVDPAFSFPAIVRHRLSNGLPVRTVEHHSVPVVIFALVVDGGSGADPVGREGLAAITADMLDEGTGSLNAIGVSDALARIGADYDIDVNPDAIVFSLTTLTRFASRGAGLMADMITRPSLREEDFARVRQMRLDRLKQLKDSPPAVAERAFLRLMYDAHPYAHLPIGTDRALEQLALLDVERFHREQFRPSRATLVVAGALSHGELVALAENAFGGWSEGDPSGPDAVVAADMPMPERSSARLAIIAREGAAQSELRIGHLSARRNTPEYPSLLVMNAVLGGQFVSRINLKLREEKGYTYGARTGFDWRRGSAPFALQASVHTAATADAVKDSLAELAAIRGLRPPSEQEMALARASLTRGYPRNFETAQQVGRSAAQLALYGLPDTYFEDFVPKVNAITSEDVVAAAARWIDPDRLTTLIVGDHAAIADSLADLGLGSPQIVPLN